LDSLWAKLKITDAHRAEFNAEIQSNPRRNGKTMPINDIWIVSIALQHGQKLYTYDKHFEFVPG